MLADLTPDRLSSIHLPHVSVSGIFRQQTAQKKKAGGFTYGAFDEVRIGH
jgi:hypothetical protein